MATTSKRGQLTKANAKGAKAVPPSASRTIVVRSQKTSAGTTVNEDDILTIPEVLACVRVLAESMASLPFELLRSEGDNIEKAEDLPLYEMVRWQPNPEMTAYELRLWMMVDALLRGRGVAQVVRDAKGKILSIWPLLASKLKPKRVEGSGKLVYTYAQSNGVAKPTEVLLEEDEVLSIQVMPYGSLLGYALIEFMRETFGASKAAQDYAAEFFANGGVVSGVVKVPDELSEDAYQRLKADWKEQHSGKGKRHSVPILESGAEFEPIAMNNEESQLLDSRKFNRSILAGIFRVPAHMINDLEKATFSNIEHQDLGFVKHSLRPWLTNWEQRCRKTLLTAEERKTLYFKHNLRDLLRGDTPSRYASYSQAIQNGILSPNDARRLEDLSPYEGGDTYLVNGTLTPIESAANPEPATGATPAVRPAAARNRKR